MEKYVITLLTALLWEFYATSNSQADLP